MVRVDTLLLAKYGIFQPTRRKGSLAMTILHPLNSLDVVERADLMEFAQMIVCEHGLGDFSPVLARDDAADAEQSDEQQLRDDEDEGVLYDEA